MGILVQNDEERTGLSERISADLRERASRSSKPDGEKLDVDLVRDSAYLSGTKRSAGTAFFWTAVIILGLAALIVIFTLK